VNLQSNPGKRGVLLLAHGSPDSPEEVPEFLLRVTGGRALPAEIVAEVKHRYSLIGRSPLTAMTVRQGELLAQELQLPVYVGMRNWKPFIADTLAAMQAEAVQRVVAICLAPQNSRTSVGLYRAALRPADAGPLAIDFVESWHDHPLLIQAFSEKLRSGWENACQEMKTKVPIVFTAHSVPQTTITEGDPYECQSKETAALVAREAAIKPEDWTFAFQSQGMSGGAWLGPTVEDTALELKRKGQRGVFIQPIGFLCDHVEVLYDIDVGFKQFAEKVGMRLWRAESLNDSPVLTAALADLARQRIPAFAAKP
jgi:protoporphyrin/coproporphyrin ferrochelatase